LVASWDEEIAWAAGFFEGEGSITLHGPRLALSIKNRPGEVADAAWLLADVAYTALWQRLRRSKPS
jgi:hypothetical protein